MRWGGRRLWGKGERSRIGGGEDGMAGWVGGLVDGDGFLAEIRGACIVIVEGGRRKRI